MFKSSNSKAKKAELSLMENIFTSKAVGVTAHYVK
jgi:hypothetical protein